MVVRKPKRRSETDPRCPKHRSGPLHPYGVSREDPEQVRQATEQAAQSARERLLERDPDRVPAPPRVTNGCPSCAGEAALAYLHGDGEPYVPKPQRPATLRPVSPPKNARSTETVPAELPAPTKARRRVGIVAHTIRYR